MGVDWGIVARAIHIVGVVVWIGGVWFVTLVFLPSLRGTRSAEWLEKFEEVEGRFAPQARLAVLLVLVSGLYMLQRYELWQRFAEARSWWMDLMVGVWLVFALILFVLEPLGFDRIIRRRALKAPEATLALLLGGHRIALALALLAVLAAVAGSHALF
jgi:uncharacterized membrane protein